MRVCFVVIAVLACASCGDDGAAAGVDAAAGGDISFPDGQSGLQRLMGDVVRAIDAGDRKRTERLVRSFELPEPRVWFVGVFGVDRGDGLTGEYAPTLGQFDQLADVLSEVVSGGRSAIEVERFATKDEDGATGYQARALAVMDKPVPLYSVRFRPQVPGKGTDGAADDGAFHLWSFVYERRTFRWVGKMASLVAKPEVVDGIDKLEFRVRDADKAVELLKKAGKGDKGAKGAKGDKGDKGAKGAKDADSGKGGKDAKDAKDAKGAKKGNRRRGRRRGNRRRRR